MLRLTVADVAKLADVSPNTVVRVEAEKPVNTTSLRAIQAALETAGATFRGDECVCACGAAAQLDERRNA